MPEHFSKSTVQATVYCPKCRKDTPHHVADGRRAGCMTCIAKLQPKSVPVPTPIQQDLFAPRKAG